MVFHQAAHVLDISGHCCIVHTEHPMFLPIGMKKSPVRTKKMWPVVLAMDVAPSCIPLWLLSCIYVWVAFPGFFGAPHTMPVLLSVLKDIIFVNWRGVRIALDDFSQQQFAIRSKLAPWAIRELMGPTSLGLKELEIFHVESMKSSSCNVKVGVLGTCLCLLSASIRPYCFWYTRPAR